MAQFPRNYYRKKVTRKVGTDNKTTQTTHFLSLLSMLTPVNHLQSFSQLFLNFPSCIVSWFLLPTLWHLGSPTCSFLNVLWTSGPGGNCSCSCLSLNTFTFSSKFKQILLIFQFPAYVAIPKAPPKAKINTLSSVFLPFRITLSCQHLPPLIVTSCLHGEFSLSCSERSSAFFVFIRSAFCTVSCSAEEKSINAYWILAKENNGKEQ